MHCGRFIAGASIGILSTNVPVYQSEVAAPHQRGALVAAYQLAITLGISLAFWLNWALEGLRNGWRVSILAQLAPGLTLLVGMLSMPRSPRWLVSKGRHEEARRALEIIRGEAEVEAELRAMVDDIAHEAATLHRANRLCSPSLRPLLALGVGLQLLQQLCGMNAFMYYGPKIFGLIQSGAATQQQGSAHGANSMDGANSRDGAFLFTAINGVVMVLATVPGILLVDRVGRTVLLRYSAAGMLVSCLVLGIVGSSCMESAACGYAASGAIFFFVFNFAYGWGPVIWVYCAEMFPLVHRSRATGATTMANWAGNFCLAFFPPLLISTIGYATFFVFAFFCLLGLRLACWLPETRGKSLEQISELMRERGLLAHHDGAAPTTLHPRGCSSGPRATAGGAALPPA